MGPKLVLVIALLGAASPDWLASGEQGDKLSTTLTPDEAERKLRDPSLEPDQVTEILKRLDQSSQIDEFYVSSLLHLNTTGELACDETHQQCRELTCVYMTISSLKNYCYHLVQHFREYCRTENALTFEQNIEFKKLKEHVEKLMRAANKAMNLRKDVFKAIFRWVAKLDSDEQESFKTRCERFLRLESRIAQHFGIILGVVGQKFIGSNPLKYLYNASLHCRIVVYAVESAQRRQQRSWFWKRRS
jgi:hypothetical protein